MGAFRGERVIVASVARGPYTNWGNRLIEQSTLRLLGLPESCPAFSVFEPIDDRLLETINAHDLLVVTGCTTLQDHGGHHACFDEQFTRIRIPKICFGASFYCEPEERPSLRIARLYDRPIGARDPWTADYLSSNGIDCELVGCPTLLEGPDLDDWVANPQGTVLISSTPALPASATESVPGGRRRWIAHHPGAPGEELRDAAMLDGTALVLTGRLHAALPAIARGIPVRFWGPEHWGAGYREYAWGRVRYALLEHLGIASDGGANEAYPAARIRSLRRTFRDWLATLSG